MNTNQYTQKTLEALQAAQQLAVEYQHNALEPEHLLHALASQEQGLIPQLLQKLNVDPGSFAAAVAEKLSALPRVSGSGRDPDKVYISQAADKVLSAAAREAKAMKDEYVSVEHVFLGLLDEPTQNTTELFRAFNIKKDAFLQQLTAVRGNQRVTNDNPEDTYNALQKYGQDLVDLARKQKLDPVIGRDQEIRNVIRILSRKTKNNPCLIGEPGVGKTAIAEGLAQRIVRGDVPENLKDRTVFPVLCGAADSGIGTEAVLQAIVDYVPNPAEVGKVATADGGKLAIDPNGPVCAFVFKTISDQFGKYSFIKVLSGKVTSDLSLRDVRMSSTDKLGRMYTMCGKKNTEVKEACCGDIVAIGKMEWKTGDTVCDPKNEVELPAIELAEPCYSMAISPKTKGQDDKVASGLARLNEEDISFTLVNNAETHQMVISGAGDIQVDVLCAKLKSRFGVETELKPARVAYREKIKGKVEAHGRHKKQSGGSGQFGDVWIRFEPQDESDDMIFEEEVFGGSVPKNFFPSVEKGLRNAVQKGVLAGYPLVGLKAVLYDGSYHPVDSNDMAFQTAARLAYQDGIPKAKPTILEPIGLLKVTIPDANLGDIMSDISSKRRGTVLGMTAEDGMQTVEAEVPMAEMGSYTIDLRSMTQGRGSFSCKFVRYEEAPGNVQQKVIEEAKKEQEA